jgi:hypothetical protein
MGIKYQHQDKGNLLYNFSDMDWVNDKNTRQSISGYYFMLANGVVTWVNQKKTLDCFIQYNLI